MGDNIQTPKSSTPLQITNIFSKENRRLIVDIIVIIIPFFLIYLYFVAMNALPEINQAIKDNKNIQSKIDSINADNQFIVSRMYELEKNQAVFFDMVNKNNELIQENNKQLTKLKKAYNDKINSVSTYDVSQLDSFFTNRYRDYYNR